MEAYQVQFSYNGYWRHGISIWSPKEITPAMIGNITRDGKVLYPDINKHINKKQ